MQHIHILGRQPALGIAELEALHAAEHITPLLPHAALLQTEQPTPQIHLGGTIKRAELIETINSTSWRDVVAVCSEHLPALLKNCHEGKINIGMSAYGFTIPLKELQASTLSLKKQVRAYGRSARAMDNKELALNTAQVFHNKLDSYHGIEFVAVTHHKKTYIGYTISVQNIDEYARRDYHRPNRDAFVGMLPPKLTQIMLNTAHVTNGQRLLDPFCGTGVVLQEAALRGCAVYGTDLSEKMVRYTRDNIAWLTEEYGITPDKFFEVGDATDMTWRPPIDAVVCETYLGQPLSGLPKPEKLSEIMSTCNLIVEKFLRNLRPQLTPGTRCTIAVPAWNTTPNEQNPHKIRFKHLRVLDRLEEMGYNRTSFMHASNSELIYHRSDQIVARELLVLQVK